MITIISHDFKKRRFLELHTSAIHWPTKKIYFLGIDPPEDVVKREVLDAGESKNGYRAFKDDPYGVGTFLQGKRRTRGWENARVWEPSIANTDNRVLNLLLWSGGNSGRETFPDQLPWEGDDATLTKDNHSASSSELELEL